MSSFLACLFPWRTFPCVIRCNWNYHLVDRGNFLLILSWGNQNIRLKMFKVNFDLVLFTVFGVSLIFLYFLFKMIRLGWPSLSLSVIIVLRIGSGLVNYPGWPWVHLRVWINWLALQSIIRYYVFPTPHIAIWINKPYVCLSINFPDKCIFFFHLFCIV